MTTSDPWVVRVYLTTALDVIDRTMAILERLAADVATPQATSDKIRGILPILAGEFAKTHARRLAVIESGGTIAGPGPKEVATIFELLDKVDAANRKQEGAEAALDIANVVIDTLHKAEAA